MRKKKSYNRWEIACFVSFGAAAAYFLTALCLDQYSSAEIRPEFMLFPAAGFVAFGTTSAMRKGEFFIQFGECSRTRTPTSFWLSVTLGYAFSVALLMFFVIII